MSNRHVRDGEQTFSDDTDERRRAEIYKLDGLEWRMNDFATYKGYWTPGLKRNAHEASTVFTNDGSGTAGHLKAT